MVVQTGCGRTTSWPQSHPTALRTNRKCEPSSALRAHLLLWLNGNKPLQRAGVQNLLGEDWNQMSSSCPAASVLLHKCLLDGRLAPKKKKQPLPPHLSIRQFRQLSKKRQPDVPAHFTVVRKRPKFKLPSLDRLSLLTQLFLSPIMSLTEWNPGNPSLKETCVSYCIGLWSKDV